VNGGLDGSRDEGGRVRGIFAFFFSSLAGLAGLSAAALADLTPPAIDVLPCPSCRGAAADIDACDRALEEENDDKAIELCSRALRSEQLSDYDRAVGHLDRGAAYDNKGQLDRAIRDYDEAIRLQPDLAYAYNNRGVVHRNRSEFDRAIEDFDRAIAHYPDYFNAHVNRGLAYEGKDDYDQAIKNYDHAIRLRPDDVRSR
jgi:tetratricopeptide (TPR) repeat protein